LRKQGNNRSGNQLLRPQGGGEASGGN
jgi:hypothetical protein